MLKLIFLAANKNIFKRIAFLLCTLSILILSFYLVSCSSLTPTSTSLSTSEPLSSAIITPDTVSTTEQLPAAFQITGMLISPARINPGDTAIINVGVANRGHSSGTYKTELKINNETEQVVNIDLDPGKSENLTFRVVKNNPGTYKVTIDKIGASFEVINPITLPELNTNQTTGYSQPSCCPSGTSNDTTGCNNCQPSTPQKRPSSGGGCCGG